MSPPVTIVMYHFVRPPDPHRFPRLPAIDPAAFRSQLAYLARHYSPVRLRDIMEAAAGSRPLPPRPVALTFDDGYADHYRHVLPLLREADMPAAFFPVRSALVDRCLLDVNKLQFVLAAAPDPSSLVAEIERDLTPQFIADARAAWWTASRFDPEPVVYIKHLLQHGLAPAIRAPLLDRLFREHVTDDAGAFADELYLTVDEARDMRAAGMEFGAHADRHVPLPTLDRAGQAAEIDGALAALDEIGEPRAAFSFAYVKGQHDATSLALLRDRGCGLAVTTRVALAHAVGSELLTLPRLDTNDLPTNGTAAPNAWTARASA